MRACRLRLLGDGWEEGLWQLRKARKSCHSATCESGFYFVKKKVNVPFKLYLSIQGEVYKLGGTFAKESSPMVLPKVTEC